MRDEPWALDGKVSQQSFANGFSRIAKQKEEWAGMPVPLMGERLVIEESYTYADKQDRINQLTCPTADHICSAEDINEETALRNEWWSSRKMGTIRIWQVGKRFTFDVSRFNRADCAFATVGCSDAWSLETESRAMETLRALISHRKLRQYLLTGSFLETSKRSDVTYMFRRLKPTLAISSRTGQLRILCALCLHPVAYYAESWAGAQCPTDDVIAHLMLMRGDEHMFWKRANQHHAIRPEAGL